MKNQYKQGELTTPIQHNVNSLIMEVASEIADEKVYREFGEDAYINEEDESGTTNTIYNPNAQDDFNYYYEKEMSRLYNLINEVKRLEEEI